MEAVLHIEPIVRQSPTPLHIGHTEALFYGEPLTVDDENVGNATSMMMLGAPLSGVDIGQHENGRTTDCVPLVKTVEYRPDPSRSKGNLYLETTHYLKDRQFLIPFRTKLRSGLGTNMRISHLPSLNLARKEATGVSQDVCDPRSHVVMDVLLRDEIFRRRKNPGLQDWLMQELHPALDHHHYTTVSFDSDDINKMVPQYINQVRDTPTEFGVQDLKYITEVINPVFRYQEKMVPGSFFSPSPMVHHLSDARFSLIPNTFDFRSYGTIPIRRLERIEYNPAEFQDICNRLDFIPLTDFNADFVVAPNDAIVFKQVHLAVNRFGVFNDVDMGLYDPSEVLMDYIDEEFLNTICGRFYEFHRHLTDEIREIMFREHAKIKLMKTMSDEAAILVYRADSAPDDPPLCGVYFDIALQSMAPMSVMPIPMPN